MKYFGCRINLNVHLEKFVTFIRLAYNGQICRQYGAPKFVKKRAGLPCAGDLRLV